MSPAATDVGIALRVWCKCILITHCRSTNMYNNLFYGRLLFTKAAHRTESMAANSNRVSSHHNSPYRQCANACDACVLNIVMPNII